MGWKGALRSIQAEARRQERAQQRRYRELERQQKHLAKLEAIEAAQYEVEAHRNRLAVLTSVHVDCGPEWDWTRIASRPEPTPPTGSTKNGDRARRELALFKPSFLDGLLGREASKIAALEQAVIRADQADEALFEQAVSKHAEDVGVWLEAVDLAKRVTEGEPEAYLQVVEDSDAFSEIEGLGSSARLAVHSSSVMIAALDIHGDEVIPRESKSLLKSGKLSVKQMPKGQFFELYQDYVCGAVLRLGRELLALLPVDMVVCHARTEMLNTGTGHLEDSTVLSAAMPRRTMDRLNFSTLDPSDALSNFVHKMDFKKTKGFAAVEPIDPASLQTTHSEPGA